MNQYPKFSKPVISFHQPIDGITNNRRSLGFLAAAVRTKAYALSPQAILNGHMLWFCSQSFCEQ